MKLEYKFIKAFFYKFLIGISISIIIVVVIISYYSNDYIDKKTAKNIYTMEKKYSTINLNSINILLSNSILKIQVGLQELYEFYKSIASKIADRSKSLIGKDVHNMINITLKDRIQYSSIWFVDRNTREVTDKNSNLYQQLSVFSQLTQTLYSVYFSMNNIILDIFFLFEDTNLFISYPFEYINSTGCITQFYEYNDNPTWCIDEKGNKINYYRFKCREFFNDIMKAKEDIFDINIKDQQDRKIFITTPYEQFGENKGEVIITMCIEFNDSISNNNAYICADINLHNLFESFNSFNEKLRGYFAITSIGFGNAFYSPQMSLSGYGKTIGEYVFRWDQNYYLEDKLNFTNIIQKKMTSNYLKYINKKKIEVDPTSIYDEIYIDGSEGENQYFF